MHYLIISSEFPPGPGGIGKHAFCMAKALINNGVNVSVVCNMDHVNEAEIELFLSDLPGGLSIHRVKRQGILTYTNRIKTILRFNKLYSFDKIIVTGQFSIWMGGVLKIISKRTEIIAFVHGTELFIGGVPKQELTKFGLRKADKVYAVSNYTAELTRQLVKKNISVLPNGLDIAEWGDDVVNSFDWKGYPNLLTVGSITTRKGQHNVISALPQLIKKYPHIHYHMVGLPVEKQRINELAKQLNIPDHISFYGRLNNAELKAAYRSADIYIMLSEESKGDIEGFGIAILEANIMGVPAIGSKGSGIEDAIKDGYNGCLVDSKDEVNIVAAVNEILSSDIEDWERNCKDWALQHDWDELVKVLM